MAGDKNPIKYVVFSERDYFEPKINGGGNSTPHKPVTPKFRQELLASIDGIAKKMIQNNTLNEGLMSAAVVELESKAVAKSNRPTEVFNDTTCPFFGDVGFAKFLIEISPEKLPLLSEIIEKTRTASFTKALSAIKSITLYEPDVNIMDETGSVSIRLFRFNSSVDNTKMDQSFESLLNVLKVQWEKHPSEVLRLYRVNSKNVQVIETLKLFSGVSRIVSSKSISIAPMVLSDSAPEDASIEVPEDRDYPVVAVVDSGVSPICNSLLPWVVGRENYVADGYRDFSHGTFVTGLISNGYYLNGQDGRFPKSQAKVLSVEVIGNQNAEVEAILEAMYEVAESNSDIRVWNLSLGASIPASMSVVSEMAVLIDEFQDRFDCLCVVSAGNYNGEPRRPWPPIDGLDDGVSSPGDSVRCITVGSVAHVNGFVEADKPSHFSRKGPVSNFIQKPEVVHYGGNYLFSSPSKMLGVNSICPVGKSTENIGTSFSAPLISGIAANLFSDIGERATPSLIKGLLIHSANINQSPRIADEFKPYYGWGIPQDVSDILAVSDHEITMVLDGIAKKSFEIEKLPFPIPKCLRTEEGKVRAEFFMTLVYQPELDPRKAYEYCQVNLDVGLGSINEEGFKSLVPLQTASHEYEKDLVKSGGKWSPVKVYHKRFPQGTNVDKWRLRLSVLNREGYEAEGVMVPFSLIITIRDIDGEQPVYNEMVQLMDRHTWKVSDLIVDTQIQV